MGWRLIQQGWPYRWHLAGLFLLSLLAPPLALLTPVPLKLAVDNVIQGRPLPALLATWLPAAVPHSPGLLLLVIASLLVGVALLDQMVETAGAWLTSYTSERFLRNFRAQLFHHIQRLPLAYHDARGTADSLYRIQVDAASVQRVTIESLVPFLSSALTAAGMAWVTFRINWQLALVALSVGPAVFWLSRVCRKRLRQRSREVRKIESEALSLVHEALGAARVVKAFGQEAREEARFARKSAEGIRARLRLVLAEGQFGFLAALLATAGTASVLFVGVRGVQAGQLTLGDLLLVMSYVAQLQKPIKTIGRKLASLQLHLAGAERAFALLDEKPDVAEHPQARPLVRAQGAVTFDQVSFAYDDTRTVLRDVSFRIAPGTCLGVVGATGSGKTTLVSLLTRFYDPSGGAILLDHVDLREYQLADLRHQFAIVLQEPLLFSTSIAENIAYACPGASEAAIIAAAQHANVHDFIRRLPDGYLTRVGERGMKLSGGERQRISIARAFLKDAPILILDEPTSAVDVKTEALIVEALERLTRGRTTFIITHRESALRHCQQILRLEAGSVLRLEHVPPPPAWIAYG
jgi:ATP-binding cassette subfamily B protein